MPAVEIGHYYAQWRPSTSSTTSGTGMLILRNAASFTDLHTINDLDAEDFKIMLNLLQTEKPIFWETTSRYLRTAHQQAGSTEPVGEEEGS